MQNIIIENWYFKSFVDNKKEKKKSRDKEQISRTLNRNKYAAACIRMHAHTYVAYTSQAGFRAIIN